MWVKASQRNGLHRVRARSCHDPPTAGGSAGEDEFGGEGPRSDVMGIGFLHDPKGSIGAYFIASADPFEIEEP